MRLRYVLGIWIAGALIAGFALGQIVERHLFMDALQKRGIIASPPGSGTPQTYNVRLSPSLRV